MYKTRPILLGYAIVAAVVLLVLCVLTAQAAKRLGADEHARSVQLEQQQALLQDLETQYKTLERQQREERANYDPQAAVQMSIQVQQAKETYAAAAAQVEGLKTELDAATDRKERVSVRLVPLIILVLLHLVLAVGMRPQKVNPRITAERMKRAG